MVFVYSADRAIDFESGDNGSIFHDFEASLCILAEFFLPSNFPRWFTTLLLIACQIDTFFFFTSTLFAGIK